MTLRDLELEELHAAQKAIYARIQRLHRDGCPEGEIYQRLIATDPVVDGEAVADTCLRFAILPESPLPRRPSAEEIIQEAISAYAMSTLADPNLGGDRWMAGEIATALRDAGMLNK